MELPSLDGLRDIAYVASPFSSLLRPRLSRRFWSLNIRILTIADSCGYVECSPIFDPFFHTRVVVVIMPAPHQDDAQCQIEQPLAKRTSLHWSTSEIYTGDPRQLQEGVIQERSGQLVIQ